MRLCGFFSTPQRRRPTIQATAKSWWVQLSNNISSSCKSPPLHCQQTQEHMPPPGHDVFSLIVSDTPVVSAVEQVQRSRHKHRAMESLPSVRGKHMLRYTNESSAADHAHGVRRSKLILQTSLTRHKPEEEKLRISR